MDVPSEYRRAVALAIDGEVLEELIALAKDVRATLARGEETGLTEDEIAFYEGLAANESAKSAMGEAARRVIVHELVASLRSKVTVDWTQRESARARMLVLVLLKRIPRR